MGVREGMIHADDSGGDGGGEEGERGIWRASERRHLPRRPRFEALAVNRDRSFSTEHAVLCSQTTTRCLIGSDVDCPRYFKRPDKRDLSHSTKPQLKSS
jgi:hypothetical protein